MAAGIIRKFSVPVMPSCYLPMILLHTMSDEEEEIEAEQEERESEEEEEEEEEDVLSSSSDASSNLTNQLLRFADFISQDVMKYFGHRKDDPDACDIYSNIDHTSTSTSGQRRYYDDLIRLATGSPESVCRPHSHQEMCISCSGGAGSLGPLAELFEHQTGKSQGHCQPMSKRHLPLSFWNEPIPVLLGGTYGSPENTPTHDNIHTHPDFSDLLAHWEPIPDPPHTPSVHTLTTHTHSNHTHIPTTHTHSNHTHIPTTHTTSSSQDPVELHHMVGF